MKAWVFSSKDDAGGWVEIDRGQLPDLPVHVRVTHSALNYKDALSITRKAPISRRFPMVPGIDLVGTIIEDASGRFAPGTGIVATGWGLGETAWGAYSEEARLDPAWVMPIPAGVSPELAAAIGTSGITAALAVEALERFGVRPAAGPTLVTGPTGGVGSLATWLLARAGHHVVAATGRPAEAGFLQSLGATEILDRAELEVEPKPLAKERWASGIDVAGGKVLANLLSGIRYGGAVAVCGLAGSMALPTTVAPFILRGVSLLGIDSVMAPAEKRNAAWARLAGVSADIPFERFVARHRFAEVADLAPRLLAGQLRGRVVLGW